MSDGGVRKVIVTAATRADARTRGLAEARAVFTLLEVHAVVGVEAYGPDHPAWPPAPRWTVTVATSPAARSATSPESVLDNLSAWADLIAAIYGPYVEAAPDPARRRRPGHRVTAGKPVGPKDQGEGASETSDPALGERRGGLLPLSACIPGFFS